MNWQNKITILVNSSDGFEDCWEPFFCLLKKHWPNCKYPILLNTEYKDYQYPGLNIKASKANASFPERRLTWSECLQEALKQIETPLLLYMQEDYFIDKPVLEMPIELFADKMINNGSINFIGLTHFGSCPPFVPYSKDDNFYEITKKARYRVSTQAGLWSRQSLLSLLMPDENGWMFEIFGTRRARRSAGIFLTSNRELYNPLKGTAIINYTLTGIIKGKWHVDMPALFAHHNLKMDFAKRGFYKKRSYLFRKIETTKKLLKDPLKFCQRMWG
jgi:hypothetical protein